VTRGTVAGITQIKAINTFQVDAPINPGNSGGPLVNDSGQVVGIVNAKFSAEGIEGVGFAVPVNYARPLLNDNLTDTVLGPVDAPKLDGPALAKRVSNAVAFVQTTIGAGGGGPKADAGVAEVVKAQRFVMVDGKGNDVLEMGINGGGGPGIWLRTPDGHDGLSIVLTDDGPCMKLQDPVTEETLVRINCSRATGPTLAIMDAAGNIRYIVALSPKIGVFTAIQDARGNMVWSAP
jgi:hypothetical protein